MKITQITQLKQQGFTVEKNSNFQTVVSHKKPFVVHGENGVRKAHLKEGKYTMVFAGLCSNGEVPYVIEQTQFPLFNEMAAAVEAKNRQIVEQRQQTTTNTRISTTLGKILNGQKFFKEQDSTVQYRKLSNTTYVKCSTLLETFDMISTPDMQIFVEMMDMDLTPEQKQELVSSMEPNLSRDEFDEIMGAWLEDVPGLDMMSDDERVALHDELYAMYQQPSI